MNKKNVFIAKVRLPKKMVFEIGNRSINAMFVAANLLVEIVLIQKKFGQNTNQGNKPIANLQKNTNAVSEQFRGL